MAKRSSKQSAAIADWLTCSSKARAHAVELEAAQLG
jgi:hypothetical protein